jgi:hypothetical protein
MPPGSASVSPAARPEPPRANQSCAVEWKARKDGAHPLYKTTSQEVGEKPIGFEGKVAPPDHPKGGGFSKQFQGHSGTGSGGLRTGITRHRYLRELDGIA